MCNDTDFDIKVSALQIDDELIKVDLKQFDPLSTSPLIAGDLVFFFSKSGQIVVANENGQIIAVKDHGDLNKIIHFAPLISRHSLIISNYKKDVLEIRKSNLTRKAPLSLSNTQER